MAKKGIQQSLEKEVLAALETAREKIKAFAETVSDNRTPN